MSTLYVLAPVTHMHENVDWSREQPRFRELLLRQLEKVGVRDVANRIRFERVLTPMDWDRGHQIHLGATFNLRAQSLDKCSTSVPTTALKIWTASIWLAAAHILAVACL